LSIFLGMSPATTNATPIDLTIEVAGDLAKHGGVITVYPLPVPSAPGP
jgi:hypothetical protein